MGGTRKYIHMAMQINSYQYTRGVQLGLCNWSINLCQHAQNSDVSPTNKTVEQVPSCQINGHHHLVIQVSTCLLMTQSLVSGCVEGRKHLKAAGQRPSRTDFGHPWCRCFPCWWRLFSTFSMSNPIPHVNHCFLYQTLNLSSHHHLNPDKILKMKLHKEQLLIPKDN